MEEHQPKTYQAGEIPGVITIDQKKCKGCDSCKRVCPTGAINGMFGAAHSIDADKCLSCGQCLVSCPFGAPYETSDPVDTVLSKLNSKDLTVVGIIAPAVRVAIGEEFGLPAGRIVTGELYASMEKAGFKILDNNLTADLTIMEEGTELLHRVRARMSGEGASGHAGPLPQFTSCCPAWVRFVELNYPALIPHLSSAKSPQQMAGSLAKTYGATRVWKTAPENIYTVGIMPCTAKKVEASRPEFKSAYSHLRGTGAYAPDKPFPDVDTVLTTRDLANLLKKKGVDLARQQKCSGTTALAEYSGAGTIFGNTGGVMEAAVRTVHAVLTGREMDTLELRPVRGLKGVKSTSLSLACEDGKTLTVNVAVVHGLKDNIASIVEETLSGRSPYHFIEVMNCPGGCINGGGQPIPPDGSGWLGSMAPLFAWK